MGLVLSVSLLCRRYGGVFVTYPEGALCVCCGTEEQDLMRHVRVHNEDGTTGHAEVRIGDSVVMMFDAGRDRTDRPAFLADAADMIGKRQSAQENAAAGY